MACLVRLPAVMDLIPGEAASDVYTKRTKQLDDFESTIFCILLFL